MFRQKRHQIKHGCAKTYLYFSILIYKTTTTNINSSEYIMLKKHPLLWHSSYNATKKNRSENDEPCFFSLLPVCSLWHFLHRADFWLAFLSERNRMFHRMLGRMYKRGNRWSKIYSHKTFRKGYCNKWLTFTYFKISLFFSLRYLKWMFVLVYCNKNLLHLC